MLPPNHCRDDWLSLLLSQKGHFQKRSSKLWQELEVTTYTVQPDCLNQHLIVLFYCIVPVTPGFKQPNHKGLESQHSIQTCRAVKRYLLICKQYVNYLPDGNHKEPRRGCKTPFFTVRLPLSLMITHTHTIVKFGSTVDVSTISNLLLSCCMFYSIV